MTTPVSYPIINGARFSWSSVELKIAGQIFYATSINYTRKRTRTMVRVNHPDPVGKTIGSNEYTADCELLLAEYNALQAVLIAQGSQQSPAVGYGDVPFLVIVQYNSNGFDTVTDTLVGCTMDSTESSGSESPDPLKRKFELNPLKIYFQGTDDLANSLGAPPAG